VTPVAVLEPVNILGVTVQRATLHNKKFMDELKVKLGDTVVIERSGDVIPKVVGVVARDNTNSEGAVNLDWTHCPCPNHQPLVVRSGKVDMFCEFPACPQQLLRKVIHFASALNIDGLGPATVEELANFGLINNISDIFELDKRQHLLEDIPRWGNRKVTKLLESIEHSRQNASFAQVLFGLGIPQVGKEVTNVLVSHFSTFNNLQDATKGQLLSMAQVGEKMAESIFGYFHNTTDALLVQQLKKYLPCLSVSPVVNTVESDVKTKFYGKTFVFTGKFATMSREQASNLVVKAGGTVKNTVGTQVDYLVVGQVKNSKKKIERSSNLGTIVLTETQFVDEFNRLKVN